MIQNELMRVHPVAFFIRWARGGLKLAPFNDTVEVHGAVPSARDMITISFLRSGFGLVTSQHGEVWVWQY